MVKAEREADRREEFDAENMRRFQKGLPLREWVDAYEDEEEADTIAQSESTVDDPAAATEAETDVVEAEEIDPLLEESGYILADLLDLSERGYAAADSRARSDLN